MIHHLLDNHLARPLNQWLSAYHLSSAKSTTNRIAFLANLGIKRDNISNITNTKRADGVD
jgi:hypothetical protein